MTWDGGGSGGSGRGLKSGRGRGEVDGLVGNALVVGYNGGVSGAAMGHAWAKRLCSRVSRASLAASMSPLCSSYSVPTSRSPLGTVAASPRAALSPTTSTRRRNSTSSSRGRPRPLLFPPPRLLFLLLLPSFNTKLMWNYVIISIITIIKTKIK